MWSRSAKLAAIAAFFIVRATNPVRFLDRPNFESEWAMMEKAIELDPGFAPAYAEMAQFCLYAWLDARSGDRFRNPMMLADAWG